MAQTKTEILAEGFKLLDGPRWRKDRLFMSDILGGKVYSVGLDGSDFLRVTEGGTITQRIHVGNARAVACTLGGHDLRTLLLLTCEGSWEKIRDHRGHARVEITKVDVPGTGSP